VCVLSQATAQHLASALKHNTTLTRLSLPSTHPPSPLAPSLSLHNLSLPPSLPLPLSLSLSLLSTLQSLGSDDCTTLGARFLPCLHFQLVRRHGHAVIAACQLPCSTLPISLCCSGLRVLLQICPTLAAPHARTIDTWARDTPHAQKPETLHPKPYTRNPKP
jgi:hypothetical protein